MSLDRWQIEFQPRQVEGGADISRITKKISTCGNILPYVRTCIIPEARFYLPPLNPWPNQPTAYDLRVNAALRHRASSNPPSSPPALNCMHSMSPPLVRPCPSTVPMKIPSLTLFGQTTTLFSFFSKMLRHPVDEDTHDMRQSRQAGSRKKPARASCPSASD